MRANSRTYAVLASVLFHLLFIGAWAAGLMLGLFGREVNKVQEPDPIVFELQEPTRPRQVVETPEDATVEKPVAADYLSDKNALARNEQQAENLPLDKAFAVGDLHAAELPTPRGQPSQSNSSNVGERERQKEASRAAETPQENAAYRHDASDFRRDLLVKPSEAQDSGAPQGSMRAQYDNQKSQALESGGLSFNTYEWDFAPYMIWLKKRVEQNVFPPPAYTRMGIIDGETVIRFRISPNGEMSALQVVEYKGHKTLMETSYRAIEISAPFKALPTDFPEPFLEVTAVFRYTVQRSR